MGELAVVVLGLSAPAELRHAIWGMGSCGSYMRLETGAWALRVLNKNNKTPFSGPFLGLPS